jgi:hypothetical protein
MKNGRICAYIQSGSNMTGYKSRFPWEVSDDTQTHSREPADVLKEGCLVEGAIFHFTPTFPDDYVPYMDRITLIKWDFVRKVLGFNFVWWNGTVPGTSQKVAAHMIVIPQWLVLLFCIPIPALAVQRVLKKVRAKHWARTGKCAHCGWDLRGTPPAAADGSRRCAECGHVNPALQSSANSSSTLTTPKTGNGTASDAQEKS